MCQYLVKTVDGRLFYVDAYSRSHALDIAEQEEFLSREEIATCRML